MRWMILAALLLSATQVVASEMPGLVLGAVLGEHVDDTGRVDYAALAKDRVALDRYAELVGKINPKDLGSLEESERLAFWINAYNGLTLKLIVDHYPVNSIREIEGAWDKILFRVAGEEMTLDHLEHEIIRKRFNDARVHMALVCAALSCPPLRNEAYTGERLETQLADQSRRFLADPEHYTVDSNGLATVSRIFVWFAEDFNRTYIPTGAGEKWDGARAFFAKYAPARQGSVVSVQFSEYDWRLNRQTN